MTKKVDLEKQIYNVINRLILKSSLKETMKLILMRTILRNMIKGEEINKHIWLKINMVSSESAEQY